jgi:hypothetical protein
MDIQGVGAGPLDAGLSNITRGVPLTKGPEALAGSLSQIGADTVAGLLSELSAAQITALLNIVEPEPLPHRIAQLDALVHFALSAANAGDVRGAMAKLPLLASLDPRRVEALASESELAPMLARLTTAARLDAETWLQDATRIVQAPGAAGSPVGDVTALLLIAGRMIEAGGLANWVHSAEVLRMVIESRAPSPPIANQLEQLLRAAVAAMKDGDVNGALAKLEAFASLDPRRAEGLAFEPALAPITKDGEALLARLAAGALRDAETRLQEASQYLQAPRAGEHPIGDLKPSPHLLLAAILLEVGGYANCVRSGEVSRMAIDQYRWAPAAIATPLPGIEALARQSHARPLSIRSKRRIQGTSTKLRKAPIATHGISTRSSTA